MITKSYNPSQLEVSMADIIKSLQDTINDQLDGNNIEDIVVNGEKDNPDLLFKLIDADGDRHELVVKFIQRADHHLE